MEKTIKNILKKIESQGYKAYIVGGYVRDKLMGINSRDIDICTNALPKKVIEILNLDNKASDNYGCINIKTKKFNIDITTFRKEMNYDMHKPKSIEYIDDIKTDLLRRDFTINTILINSKGKFIDYFNGIEDVKKRQIKCVGDTKFKLKEDPLRMLRAIRFSVLYNMKLDDEIVSFIKDNGSLLKTVTTFRKKEELDKIFISKSKITGLILLKELDLLKPLGINFIDIKYTNDILGIYAQINIEEEYPFSKNEKDLINKIREVINNKEINNITLYKYGLYVNLVAGEILGYSHEKINKKYKSLPIKSRKDIKISYKDIVLIKNNCYNNLSDIYLEIENNILLYKIKNNKREIIKYLKECGENE